MKNHTKPSLLVVILLGSITAVFLSACESPPQLRQVSADAPEMPINTPQVADQLKKKYEK